VNPRRLQWSKHFRRAHGKELSVDSTFDFEKQRNTPLKYDRELYAATIQAMKKVSDIQEARQRDFYFRRMTTSLKNRKMKIRRDLNKSLDLVVNPVAKQRKAIEKSLAESAAKDAEREKLQNAGTSSVLKKKKKNKSQMEDSDDDITVEDN
jgi:large subunit ribosomal protein L24e